MTQSWLRLDSMALKLPFSEYAWPMKSKSMKPFQHQKESVVFLLQNKNAYNFSDLGTGKTLSHLWCADFLMCNDKVRKALIISPLSTVQSVWGSEIFFNFPHRKYAIAHGTQNDRLYNLRRDVDFVILNHDGVTIESVEDEIIKQIRQGLIKLIIIDELTAFKKHTTKRSKAMQRICAAARQYGCGVHGLTGSPTPNSPTEAYGLAKCVNPGHPALPRYYKQFQQLVEYQVGPYLWLPTDHANEVVNKILQPAIRFKRDDCIDIPECQYITRIVEFTPEQKKIYETMKNDMLVEYQAGQITAVNAAVKAMKLLQIASGSVKDDEGNVVSIDCKTREDQLWEIFEETGQTKLVVFAAFRATIDRLVKFFEDKKVKVATINGDVRQELRARHIDNFQNSDLQVLVIQPQSSAHGVTLTAACTTVWYSLVPSGEIYVQANGRITRAGQTRKQTIYHLIGCKAEQHILGILEGKVDRGTNLLSMFEAL